MYAISVTLHLQEIKLGIVCPMANERDCVEQFVKEVLEQCRSFKSVIFFAILDNASTDGTVEYLAELEKKEPRLSMIWAPENRCVVDAYLRGYKEALYAECDWILEIDAGFSHQPSDIPKFFNKMSEGFDCVFGSRFCKSGKITKSSSARYLISLLGGWLTNLLLGTRLSDMTSGFELFTRQALKHILCKGIRSRGHFFQTEIKVHCRNLEIAEVPIHYKSASPSVSLPIILEALRNLSRLFAQRILRTL
ncbi:MAG TPA: glycosyltransferase [Coleofasciculaceae cyanobacterium]|jgi:dolichol-phosphate mannosyltransferase